MRGFADPRLPDLATRSNEGIRNAAAALLQIERPAANTMMRSAGGGLGWSGGFALGAKLAAPERMAVQVVGDGGFYFGNPSSVFAISRQYDLPILIVVMDNSGWSAVKSPDQITPGSGSTISIVGPGPAAAASIDADCTTTDPSAVRSG